MQKRTLTISVIGLAITCLLCLAIYSLPAINTRILARMDDLRTRIKYAISPPDEAIFVPGADSDGTAIPSSTVVPTVTPTPEPTNTLVPDQPTSTPQPSATATITPTHLPPETILDGVIYVDQHNRWNYCGPANLTMALKFWGWPGNRDDIARVIKPGIQDEKLDFIQQGRWDYNVMPYEMVDFVNEQTTFKAFKRSGGDLELVRSLIAAGYPVLIEKGYFEADYTGKVAWMGHYLFTTGYDDVAREFVVQDAYLVPGKDMRVGYDEYLDGWRSFNYLFMLIYPPEREAEIQQILGPYNDPDWASTHALETAEAEILSQTDVNEFFAWFNKGSSLVELTRYAEAASAYDKAFELYAALGGGDLQRPYRIMWYQTGPYWAYHYSGRYQDVINLANTTLYETVSQPTLEESLYWRGMAEYALGQTDEAIADFLETVRLNPNFGPGLYMLAQLGISP